VQIVGPMTIADDAMPTLALKWSAMPVRGEKQTVQRTSATITIEPTGATGKLKITLTVARRDFLGADLAALTYVISAGAAKIDWDDTDYTASRTATAAVLKDVMDLINELPDFKAWVLHAPHSQTVNSDNFIALAATNIQSGVGPDDISKVLYRDVSEDINAYMRIGLPEVRDKDAIELHELTAICTGVTGSPTLKVYRDDYDNFGETQEEYESFVLAAARTSYLGYNKLTVPVIRGPILIHATSDDLSAIELRAKIKQAQTGL